MMNAQQESKTPRITLIAQQVMATASHITVNSPCIMIKTLHKRVIETAYNGKSTPLNGDITAHNDESSAYDGNNTAYNGRRTT
jgi:hypothetical protein